jgi:SAM-dependent methyltransferase
VLDPACGSGRFLLGVRERWPELELRGFETDPAALALAQAQFDGAVGGDFLLQEPTGDLALLVGNPPYVRRRGAKRDLYVDFVERAAAWVKPGGRLALVLSNAWLDVGYGADVRAALREDWAIEWIVESWAERWFPGAKVHTMLLVARRGRDDEQPVRLASVDAGLPAEPTLRRTIRQGDLPDAPWGPLLREPDAFRAVRPRLVPLGELATLRRGFTTNANAFFYPPAGAVEPTCLAPLVKSPKQVPGARAAADGLTTRVLVQPERGGPKLAAWMEQHGRTDARLRPQPPARLVLVKGYHDRFRQPLFDHPVHADQQLYPVEPKPGVDAEALAAVLNGSLAHLAVELAGRVNFGDGVLWLGLKDARNRVLVVDPRGHEAELRAAVAGLPDVAPRASGWHEHPGTVALDATVAGVLGVDPEPLRRAWQQAVARRLALAASAR